MVKVLLVFLVIAILMEDGTSIRKTEEEVKEDEEVAKAVNRTLAEEEKKKKEEEDQEKKKTKDVERREKQDEACATPNITCECPEVEHCSPCKHCPEQEECVPCQDCPPVKECGPCPTVRPCKPCLPVDCHPCSPHPNLTVSSPSTCQCPEGQDLAMTIPVAMAVGAAASLLVVGVATAVGLVIRYVSPMFSGLLFISIIVLTWYLSSHYPGTARELGGRAATLLREAATALSHRIMAAIRHHDDQVGFPV
jgi:hypothetical protein